ncbi:fatty acid desaturase [Leptolyngbya sp. 'hensonii']|nr:fatty acid desaturase [Leptolyngbya sp. 'hensonii']
MSPDHWTHSLWNLLAIGYTLIGYGTGIGLLLHPNGWLNGLGVLLLTHALVYSAYLSHEFMHGTIFTRRGLLGVRQLNALGGTLMLWLNGGCYARFDDLARLHMGHHVDRVDYAIDFPQWLQHLPPSLYGLVLALEWLHIPVIDFLLRWRSITAPFWLASRREERLRTTILLLVRGGLFLGLGLLSWKALLLYGIAYTGMVQVLRLMDAFQHTYKVFPLGVSTPDHSYAYEQANTFSNLLSQRYPWLNLLVLNFSYHNAHHHAMKSPWHRLPALDRQLFQVSEVHNRISLARQLWNYHRFRLSRIFAKLEPAVDESGRLPVEGFQGAIGVSFLVLPC